MDPFLQKKQACTPQQATALTESVLHMLIYDMRPLSMVDGAGFRQMITQFNPDYILCPKESRKGGYSELLFGAFVQTTVSPGLSILGIIPGLCVLRLVY